VADGKFSFSAEQYFDPDPATLSVHTTIEQLGVEYVLAQYSSPRMEGDWLVASIPFNAEDLYLDEGTWKFSFATPLVEELGGGLLIHKLNMWFNRTRL